jgi:hypothetical protein
VDEQCEALIRYVLHGWTGQTAGPRRRPRDLETFLRCRRSAGHEGQHRSAGSVRQWSDELTSGWLDLPDEDELRPPAVRS